MEKIRFYSSCRKTSVKPSTYLYLSELAHLMKRDKR